MSYYIILMITLQCALCGNKQKIIELYKENLDLKKINSDTFSARRIPDRIHYCFVKCVNCGLIFSSPIMSAKKIFAFYKKSSFNYDLESLYLKETYGYYLKKILYNTKKEKVQLLDIGCGNGFLLEEAKKMGIKNVFGIEPGTASVKKAPKWLQKNIKIGLFENNVYADNTFDIVCCFHTLDHIVDPNKFLQGVYKILRKGGKALFIVHDTDGLSVKIFGKKSPIFDIEHIYLFNKNNLAGLFLKNNLKVIETFGIINKYPLLYWTRMVPLPKNIKNILIFFLKITKLANFPISVNAGNIGIIAQK